MKAIKDKYLLVGADTAGFPIKEAAERAAKGNGVNVLAMGAFFVTTHMACVISASGRAVWDFWRDEQLRLDGDGAIKLEVPPCDTRVVRLTPFSAPRRNASFGFAAHSAGRIRAGVIPVRCARSIRRGEVSGRRNSESHASSAGKQGRDYILASLQTRRGCPAARTVAGVKRDCRMARCIPKPKGMNVYELR